MKPKKHKLFGRRGFLVCALAWATAIILTGCHSSVVPEQDTSARQAIVSANQEFERAFASSNTIAIASQDAEDAELLLASEQAIRDPVNIGEFFEKFMINSHAAKIRFQSAQIEQIGSFANETGTFVTSTSDGKTILDGKYITIWKLLGSQWKIQVHAFNPSRQQADPGPQGTGQTGPHGYFRSAPKQKS